MGPSWYINASENGVLVTVDDLDAFVTAVRRLRNDCGFTETLVAGGHKRLEEMFNKNRIVDRQGFSTTRKRCLSCPPDCRTASRGFSLSVEAFRGRAAFDYPLFQLAGIPAVSDDIRFQCSARELLASRFSASINSLG